jgi:hypothetical protein
MTKEYATVEIRDGLIFSVDIGAPNGSPEDAQFNGLKRFPLVYALNKLAELDYVPVQGAVDHGQHSGAPNYTVVFVREK